MVASMSAIKIDEGASSSKLRVVTGILSLIDTPAMEYTFMIDEYGLVHEVRYKGN